MRRAALAGFDPAGPTVQFYRRYRRALRTGELVRPDWCQRCGASCHPDGHHDDYTEPLRVLWLCKSCHAVAHPGRHARNREFWGPAEYEAAVRYRIARERRLTERAARLKARWCKLALECFRRYGCVPTAVGDHADDYYGYYDDEYDHETSVSA